MTSIPPNIRVFGPIDSNKKPLSNTFTPKSEKSKSSIVKPIQHLSKLPHKETPAITTTTTTTTTTITKRKSNPNKIVVYMDKEKKPIRSNKAQRTTILDLFYDDDTPIRKLPNDCLMIIFKLFKDTRTLCVLSTVSRSWRKLAQQPILWRDTSFPWFHFNKQLSLIGRSLSRRQQFHYIRTLLITAQPNIILKRDNMYHFTTSPFSQLETLNTMHMSTSDILYLTLWMPNIKTLCCRNIPVNQTTSVYMPDFSKMKQLTRLKLQFAAPCSLKVPPFTLNPVLRTLPTSLKELELINVYDDEENLITPQDVLAVTRFMREERMHWQRELLPMQILDMWLQLERKLVLKYKMLTFLPNLTHLSLARVSSFTSRVWRECLLPTGKNLSFLSLASWSAHRESPQETIRRIDQSQTIKELDLALSEFIASLSKIHTIVLNDFLCSTGFILGMNTLALNATLFNESGHPIVMTDFKDKKLFNFTILIKQKTIF